MQVVQRLDRACGDVVEEIPIPLDMPPMRVRDEYPGWPLAVAPCTCALDQRQRWRLERLTQQAGVAADSVMLTWDDFRRSQQVAYQAARLVFEGEWTGALFSGPTGTGKTSLLTLLYRDLVAQGVAAVYQNFVTLVDVLRDTYADNYDGPGVNSLMEPLLIAEFLALDDLGSPTRTLQRQTVYAEDVIKLLYRVFDERLSKGLRTAVTTNLTKDQLYAEFGDQVVSRLRGLCHGATMAGKDWRTGESR